MESAIADSPLQRFGAFAARQTIKRILLAVLLLLVTVSYVVLTNGRYLGQDMQPQYLRFSTVGDVLSLGTFLATFICVLYSIKRPERTGTWQLLATILYGCGFVWISLGVQRLDATEFPPISSVALLAGLFVLVSLTATKVSIAGTETRRGMPFLLRVIRNAIALYAVYALFGFIFNFSYPAYTDPREIAAFNADAGVVFGAAVWSGNQLGNRPSPTLRERIDVGYELLANRAIPRLVVTGASAPGEQTEANVAREEMLKRGVDPAAIITEDQSHSTFEQVRFIRDELIRKQGWSKFIVISDHYHLARILQMCKFNHIQAIGAPSQIRQPFLDLLFYRFRESIALMAYWLLGK